MGVFRRDSILGRLSPFFWAKTSLHPVSFAADRSAGGWFVLLLLGLLEQREDRLISAALIEEAANQIEHWQQRNAAARKSHIQRTRQKLQKNGIYLKDLIRGKWP